MKTIKTVLSVALVCGLAACKKPAPESPPGPKATGSARTEALLAIADSTAASVHSGGLLNAPGNYLRTAAGRVDSAKTAVKLYEKAAAESMTLDEGK